jgi:hypothetical protein
MACVAALLMNSCVYVEPRGRVFGGVSWESFPSLAPHGSGECIASSGVLSDDARIIGEQLRTRRASESIQHVSAGPFNHVPYFECSSARDSRRIPRVRVDFVTGLFQYRAKSPCGRMQCAELRSRMCVLAIEAGGSLNKRERSPGPASGGSDRAMPETGLIQVPTAAAYVKVTRYHDGIKFEEEKTIADESSVVIGEFVRNQYSAGSARRDAHPKAHGCVKAEVHILDRLPASLAKGMFIPGKTYQAWIRFSNGSGDPTRADIKRDARGMARTAKAQGRA